MGKTSKVGDNVFILSHWKGLQHTYGSVDIGSLSAECWVPVWKYKTQPMKARIILQIWPDLLLFQTVALFICLACLMQLSSCIFWKGDFPFMSPSFAAALAAASGKAQALQGRAVELGCAYCFQVFMLPYRSLLLPAASGRLDWPCLIHYSVLSHFCIPKVEKNPIVWRRLFVAFLEQHLNFMEIS